MLAEAISRNELGTRSQEQEKSLILESRHKIRSRSTLRAPLSPRVVLIPWPEVGVGSGPHRA